MPRVGRAERRQAPAKALSNEAPSKETEEDVRRHLELRERIVQHEVGKIRKMKITEVLARARQPKPDPTYVSRPSDPASVARTLNQSFDVHEGSPNEKTPGEMWAKQIMERQRLKRIYDRELNKNPLLHQIKRGRLGIDLYLIVFAATAGIMLPLYFFNRMQRNRKRVTQARGVDPDVIQYLDEHSSLNIDDVSYQSYHYRNMQREDSMRQHLGTLETVQKLQRDLEEM